MQWATIVLAILGLIYNGYKDVSNGQVKLPLTTTQNSVESRTQMPIVYWQVAFDPNTGKMYHLHKDGKWYDQPPQVREYQNQGQEALGTGYRPQGAQGYGYGQSTQATPYARGY